MQTIAPAKAQSVSPIVKGLNLLLADSYSLMALSHHAHWNVEGPGFFALHNAFQTHSYLKSV